MSIKGELSSGVLYTALSKYSGIIISLIINAILSRLLSPDEYGVVALVTVFVTFFSLLSDFGIGPAVVQNHSLDDDDTSSIFSFSILFGTLLALLFFISAPLIADFYNNKELIYISRLLSLSILFNSYQIVPRALLQKKLKFKRIGLVTIAVQFVTGILGIVLALLGFSYYALVFQSVLSAMLLFAIFYKHESIRFRIKIQKTSIQKIFKFSSFQFLFNFINYFSRNLDSILIGKYLGSESLGYYNKSYSLMMMPVSNLTHVITPVMMPVLSKYQNDKEVVYNTYMKVIKLLAIIGFPLSVFLFFSAEEIIYILFGPQWDNSVPVFKILALSVGIQMVLSSTGSIFQTINRTDLLFISGLLSAILMVGGIMYGIFIGNSLEAVGIGLLIAFSLNFIQSFFILIKVAIKHPFFGFLKTFLFPIFISICLGFVLWVFQPILPEQQILSFLIQLIISFISFVVLLSIRQDERLIMKSYYHKIVNKIRKVKNK